MKPLRARSLPLVPASFFGIVLGLIGLGNPWRVAARLWGLPVLPSELIMLAGVATWASFPPPCWDTPCCRGWF